MSDANTKICVRCHAVKPVDDFYKRSAMPHLLVSECKSCMKERNEQRKVVPLTMALVPSEVMAINALKAAGIHAAPGKSVAYADVDVVAFGCVRIEVKYARLDSKGRRPKYTFRATARQVERGLLADIAILICDDGKQKTFHLFSVADPVLYVGECLKKGFTFIPGALVAGKHGDTRVVMTQPMMDAARDRWVLVWDCLKQVSQTLRRAE